MFDAANIHFICVSVLEFSFHEIFLFLHWPQGAALSQSSKATVAPNDPNVVSTVSSAPSTVAAS